MDDENLSFMFRTMAVVSITSFAIGFCVGVLVTVMVG